MITVKADLASLPKVDEKKRKWLRTLKPGTELRRWWKMAEEDTRTISEKIADNDLITAALQRAAREAILAHARAGRAVPMSPNGDGNVVWFSPEEIFARFGNIDAPPANNS